MARFGRTFLPPRTTPLREAPQPAARSAADSVSVSDTATVNVGLARSAADSVSVSDVATRLAAISRSATDGASVSDAATQLGARARSAADSASVSDAATRAAAASRSAADSASVSDAADADVGRFRSTADSVSVSDTASKGGGLDRSAADSVPISDATARSSARDRSADDSVSVSDTASGVLTADRSATDSIGVSDAVTRLAVLAREAVDALTVGDVAARLAMGFTRSVAEAIGAVTDSAHRTARTSSADSWSVFDSASRLLHVLAAAHDSVTIADLATRGAGNHGRTATDLIVVTDAATGLTIAHRHGEEFIVVTDAVSHHEHQRRFAHDHVLAGGDVATIVLVQAEDVGGPRLRFHVRLEHPAGIVRIETIWARDLWEAITLLEAQFPGYVPDWGELEPIRRTGSGIRSVYPLVQS